MLECLKQISKSLGKNTRKELIKSNGSLSFFPYSFVATNRKMPGKQKYCQAFLKIIFLFCSWIQTKKGLNNYIEACVNSFSFTFFKVAASSWKFCQDEQLPRTCARCYGKLFALLFSQLQQQADRLVKVNSNLRRKHELVESHSRNLIRQKSTLQVDVMRLNKNLIERKTLTEMDEADGTMKDNPEVGLLVIQLVEPIKEMLWWGQSKSWNIQQDLFYLCFLCMVFITIPKLMQHEYPL